MKKSNVKFYLLTITHPDAESLVLGPMTINASADTVFVINRIMTKMQVIHENTYVRGMEVYPHTRPPHKVKITHDFLKDKYEVTSKLFCDAMNYALYNGDIVVKDNVIKKQCGRFPDIM